MTKLTYTQQLAHPLWQRRRLEMLEAASWSCANCGQAEKQLHVHHRQYFKGRMVWEYADAELQVLCKDCHERSHVLGDQVKAILCRVPPDEVLALLAGFYSGLLSEEQFQAIYEENAPIYEAGAVAACIKDDRPKLLSDIYELIVDADMKGRSGAPEGVVPP